MLSCVYSIKLNWVFLPFNFLFIEIYVVVLGLFIVFFLNRYADVSW